MSPADDRDDPTELSDEHGDQDLRNVVHELRNCLYAMGIGLALLAKSRNDAEKFNNLLEKVNQEQQVAVELLDKLAKDDS